ncbi:MAG: helix-turn-helix domain-containing protein [Tepidisphaerales bacterium]
MTKQTKAKRANGTRLGGRIIQALTEACEGLEKGRRPNEVFTVRMVRRLDPPKSYGPRSIKRLRESLGVSQAVFASILGSSVDLVQSWEIGHRAPSGMARRLLDEISRNREYWLERLTSTSR